MALEQADNKNCQDCGQTLKLLEIDTKRGLKVQKCRNCGMLHFYKKNRRGKWQLLKATVSELVNIAESPTKETSISKNVFIVHGRDHKPVKELKAMLSEFGLNPIVLHEQPSASRTIVEKLEQYSDVGYAFIILTPDDIGISTHGIPTKKAFMTITVATGKDQNKPSEFLKPRARQNVVLEFGYFMGLLGRDRVCCLHKGNVELPSDMHGIVYIPFKDSIDEVKDKIIKELEAAGYQIENH